MSSETLIRASARAATLATAFVVGITIAAELSASLKSTLASITGHHWVTKSAATVLVYAVLLAVFSRSSVPARPEQAARSLYTLVVAAFAGAALLTGYFLWHFMAL